MESLKSQLVLYAFKDGVFSHNMLRSKTNESLRYLCKKKTLFLPESSPESQRAWHVFHDLYEYPRCAGGNERRSFTTFEGGYRKTCHLPRFTCSCWDDAVESSKITMKRTNDSGKIRQVLTNRYGVGSPSLIPGVGDKISRAQQNLIFGKMKMANLTLDKLKKLRSIDWWEQHKNKSINDISGLLDIPASSVKYFSDKLNTSHLLIDKRLTKPEVKIRDWLLEIGVVHRRNDKKQIYPLELDFYIPSHSLAIEVNRSLLALGGGWR